MIPQLVASLFEVILALIKAGEDKAKQEEALMLGAERIAEAREQLKFGPKP